MIFVAIGRDTDLSPLLQRRPNIILHARTPPVYVSELGYIGLMSYSFNLRPLQNGNNIVDGVRVFFFFRDCGGPVQISRRKNNNISKGDTPAVGGGRNDNNYNKSSARPYIQYVRVYIYKRWYLSRIGR